MVAMNLSGLIFDVYDDFRGENLRAIWPSMADVPEKVKQASHLSAEMREQLPDDVFALVLINDGQKLRKYACVDEGNTQINIEFFLKNAHKLPEVAQVRAAENLKVACAWYGLEVPAALEKIALGVGTAMTALTAVPIIKGTHQAIRDNMNATHALEGAGATIATPAARNAVLKQAEVSGTFLSPNQGPAHPSPKHKIPVQKTARIGHLVAHTGTDVPPDVVHPPTKEQETKLPQAQHMRPAVDVSSCTPYRRVTEKKASHYALESVQRYPLDTDEQVKAAGPYFDTYYKNFLPSERREFASNLVKRAHALNIAVSADVQKYGGEGFAPEHEIKAAFDARRLELSGHPDVLKVLNVVENVVLHRLYKEAGLGVQECSPETAVELLEEFDKYASINHAYDRTVPDPYYSVYGTEKTAEGSRWSDVIATEMVTEEDLDRLSRVGARSVKTTFGEDFQERFLKDPVNVYKTAPLAQKKMLIRMANSTQPGEECTYY